MTAKERRVIEAVKKYRHHFGNPGKAELSTLRTDAIEEMFAAVDDLEKPEKRYVGSGTSIWDNKERCIIPPIKAIDALNAQEEGVSFGINILPSSIDLEVFRELIEAAKGWRKWSIKKFSPADDQCYPLARLMKAIDKLP